MNLTSEDKVPHRLHKQSLVLTSALTPSPHPPKAVSNGRTTQPENHICMQVKNKYKTEPWMLFHRQSTRDMRIVTGRWICKHRKLSYRTRYYTGWQQGTYICIMGVYWPNSMPYWDLLYCGILNQHKYTLTSANENIVSLRLAWDTLRQFQKVKVSPLHINKIKFDN